VTGQDWEIWFYDLDLTRPLTGGVLTVDSQLRAALSRLTSVPVSRKSLSDLKDFARHPDRFTGKRIALISHVDGLTDTELAGLAEVTPALRALADGQGDHDRPVHFTFIHSDPASSFASLPNADDFRKDRARIVKYEKTFDRLVCIGPRMFAHLKSQWPHWGEGHLMQLGAGMAERPPLEQADDPILRPMPRKSNVRVLFGSPTTPQTMHQRALDVFARAAGLVQSHFVDRHVDVTFVVSGIEPDRASSARPASATEEGEQTDLIEVFERTLVDLAKEVFDGLTEFEVSLLRDRTTWLQHELDRADIFVLPSRDEPFGLVAAEALSRGKPVIVSQNSGIGEFLLDYAAESFLPVENYVCALTPQALARSIEAVIESDRSRRLFHHIAHGAYARLSWGNAVHQLLNALDLPERFYKPAVEISEAAAMRVRREIPGAMPQDSMVLPIGQQVQPTGVRFNMPIATAAVVEEFDSNKGRCVTLETSGSVLFVRKVITDSSHLDNSSSISDMKSQWEVVGAALAEKVKDAADADIYPHIYEVGTDEQLVMEYIDGGSLDRVTSPEEAKQLTQLAVVQLLRAARTAGTPARGPTAWEFCRCELDRRCARLERAVSQLSGEEKREFALPEDLIESCREFFAARELHGADDPYVPLAIHGNFGMNNVVFKTDALRGDRIVFIDTRARWDAGRVPRWDIAFDLATLYIFAAAIQPALAIDFGFGASSPLHGQARLLAAILEQAIAVTEYAPLDRHWRSRVEAACAVRLLGSISTQIASARSNHLQRARRMAGLTEAFIRSAKPISWTG
jgi:glycosyltransferase involved in cell wall biosynthesis